MDERFFEDATFSVCAFLGSHPAFLVGIDAFSNQCQSPTLDPALWALCQRQRLLSVEIRTSCSVRFLKQVLMEERCVSCAEWPAKLRKGVRIIDIPPAIVAYVMGRSKRGKRFMTPEQLKARYNDGDLDKSEYEEYDVATAVKGANSRDAIATDDLLSLAMDVTGLSKEELLKKPDPKEGDRAGDDDDNGSSSEGWSDFEEGENEEEDQVFREWGATVDAAISALGGEAFPKLNWSAPKDAVWISGEGTLRCRTHLDVLMLLKSSDFAAADIAQAEAMGVKPVLVLKHWRNVTTASEYRCFVMKRRLVAICQRHVNDCYNLSSEAKQEIEFVVRNYINSSVVPFVPPALNSCNTYEHIQIYLTLT